MSKKKTMVLQDCFSLRARIGWQGLRADEFLDYGPYLVTGTDFVNGKVNWDTCYHVARSVLSRTPEFNCTNMICW